MKEKGGNGMTSKTVARWDEPGLYAGDAERDEATARIRAAHVEGRLSYVAMTGLLDKVYAAEKVQDLQEMLTGVPELPESQAGRLRRVAEWLQDAWPYLLAPAGLVVGVLGTVLSVVTAPVIVIQQAYQGWPEVTDGRTMTFWHELGVAGSLVTGFLMLAWGVARWIVD